MRRSEHVVYSCTRSLMREIRVPFFVRGEVKRSETYILRRFQRISPFLIVCTTIYYHTPCVTINERKQPNNRDRSVRM